MLCEPLKFLQASVIQSPAPLYSCLHRDGRSPSTHPKAGTRLGLFIPYRSSSTRPNVERRVGAKTYAAVPAILWMLLVRGHLEKTDFLHCSIQLLMSLRAFHSLQRQSSKDCLKCQANLEVFSRILVGSLRLERRNPFGIRSTGGWNCHYPNSPRNLK